VLCADDNAMVKRLAVWQKLEEQNPEFFKAYYTRLKVKDQMELFNTLLEYQAQLLHSETRATNAVRVANSRRLAVLHLRGWCVCVWRAPC
jgi:hypothetical protein